MRFFITIITLLSFQMAVSQAFYGRGDKIFQIGANFQQDGTGIHAGLDFGLGDNISLGVSSTYLLGVPLITEPNGKRVPFADFQDRFDLKGRINANLGNILNINERLDVYPGLYLSLKNFGGHIGARYFFTHGFGLFGEINFPFSKYNTDILTPAEKLHNRVSLSIGTSFGL